ncbi:dihydrofolate reductase family protein [Actinomadura rudentiformis]|uniref:Dihydrofolate reductase family protein n=1 Tax=Actinomadura rudentiformis TaxID=359158 RepID=A0A6H9Z436_9ACTN|nr:dihydrofolate reductase family protein [Actinomadura rudentiformis]KAB2348282.1 dihydrofolate reductase family protein [Actinomadura rudentiformis]
MRKLIVCNLISLDGCYTGPGDDVMAMPFDHGFDDYNAERLRAADTMLLGRTTFEGFRDYWPPVADNTDAAPVEREISRLTSDIDKVVVSDALTADQTGAWHNTQIVPRADAHKHLTELKNGPGRDILVFGSHILWKDLLAHGLVDELHLMIGPGIVGDGVRMFETRPPASFQLVETRTWEGSSLLLTRYAVSS